MADLRALRTSRRRAGDAAEDAVARHLAAAGWSVLGRNARIGRDELDILAVDPARPDVLVVVEVRSRTSGAFGEPEESVDAGKVARLYRGGAAVLRAGRLPDGLALPPDVAAGGSFRVDLVTVVRGAGGAWRLRQHLRSLEPP